MPKIVFSDQKIEKRELDANAKIIGTAAKIIGTSA